MSAIDFGQILIKCGRLYGFDNTGVALFPNSWFGSYHSKIKKNIFLEYQIFKNMMVKCEIF